MQYLQHISYIAYFSARIPCRQNMRGYTKKLFILTSTKSRASTTDKSSFLPCSGIEENPCCNGYKGNNYCCPHHSFVIPESERNEAYKSSDSVFCFGRFFS